VRPLAYSRVSTVEEAVQIVSADPSAAFLAGGTTEVDLLRAGINEADHLVDINEVDLAAVTTTDGGGLYIGALARMSDVARVPAVERNFPAISQALLLGASEQLRNMASLGGNMCQRTRCAYLRDGISRCNKRDPGSGCAALEGINRGHAILGTSEHCIATHPSDVTVPFAAFDAVINTAGPSGARQFAMDDFFLLPGDTPEREHPLDHGEMIVGIEVLPSSLGRKSIYLKFRDRQSYEFALVSVAAAIEVVDGTVADVRVAMGGVGTRPWRCRRAEATLVGQPADDGSFLEAAEAELQDADLRRHNSFKSVLAARAMVRGLTKAMDGAQ
jgi:xanthine dehydrogenase YagS FAD-binding subunit